MSRTFALPLLLACLCNPVEVAAQAPEPFEQPSLAEVEAYIATNWSSWTWRVTVLAHRPREPVELVRVDRFSCGDAYAGMAVCDVTVTGRFNDGTMTTVTVTDSHFGYDQDHRFTEWVVVTHERHEVPEVAPATTIELVPVETQVVD
jgi:hypothetical protein